MAFATYTDLRGAVAEWLARPDLEERIPDFIRIAEVQIGRRLKAVAMEYIASTPIVTGQVYYALPSLLIELRNLYLASGTNTTKLVYRTPEQLITEFPNQESECSAYTIVDGQIKLNSTSGSNAVSLAISYWRQFDPLSESNETNWLITDSPDIILYGALLAAEGYIKDDKRLPVWKTQYAEEIALTNIREDKLRHSGSHLAVRTA